MLIPIELKERTVRELYPFQRQVLEGQGVNIKKYYRHMKRVRFLRAKHNAKETARADFLQAAEVQHEVNRIIFDTQSKIIYRDKKQLSKYRHLRRVYQRALKHDTDQKISFTLNNHTI